MVNNESADIIQILNSSFNQWAERPEMELAPPSLAPEMERWNAVIYDKVNNGVYRWGRVVGEVGPGVLIVSGFAGVDLQYLSRLTWKQQKICLIPSTPQIAT